MSVYSTRSQYSDEGSQGRNTWRRESKFTQPYKEYVDRIRNIQSNGNNYQSSYYESQPEGVSSDTTSEPSQNDSEFEDNKYNVQLTTPVQTTQPLIPPRTQIRRRNQYNKRNTNTDSRNTPSRNTPSRNTNLRNSSRKTNFKKSPTTYQTFEIRRNSQFSSDNNSDSGNSNETKCLLGSLVIVLFCFALYYIYYIAKPINNNSPEPPTFNVSGFIREEDLNELKTQIIEELNTRTTAIDSKYESRTKNLENSINDIDENAKILEERVDDISTIANDEIIYTNQIISLISHSPDIRLQKVISSSQGFVPLISDFFSSASGAVGNALDSASSSSHFISGRNSNELLLLDDNDEPNKILQHSGLLLYTNLTNNNKIYVQFRLRYELNIKCIKYIHLDALKDKYNTLNIKKLNVYGYNDSDIDHTFIGMYTLNEYERNDYKNIFIIPIENENYYNAIEIIIEPSNNTSYKQNIVGFYRIGVYDRECNQ